MDVDFFKVFFKRFELNNPTFERISKHIKFDSRLRINFPFLKMKINPLD